MNDILAAMVLAFGLGAALGALSMRHHMLRKAEVLKSILRRLDQPAMQQLARGLASGVMDEARRRGIHG